MDPEVLVGPYVSSVVGNGGELRGLERYPGPRGLDGNAKLQHAYLLSPREVRPKERTMNVDATHRVLVHDLRVHTRVGPCPSRRTTHWYWHGPPPF